MYRLRLLGSFKQSYKETIKNNKKSEKRIRKTLHLLAIDPHYPSLKSHKVNTKHFGKKWSSWVTGDLRLVWDFSKENKKTINLFAISSHSGTHSEYN